MQNGCSPTSLFRRLQAFSYLIEKEVVPLKEQLFLWVQKTLRAQITMKPAYLPPGPSIVAILPLLRGCRQQHGAAGSVALDGPPIQVRCP